jgi:hypothetical protein
MPSPLNLYELDSREPCAYVDSDGLVCYSSTNQVVPRLSDDDNRILPSILFADTEHMFHLAVGITIAPLADANDQTGPAGHKYGWWSEHDG